MSAIFDLIAQTPVAEYLRGARWGYAAINTAHILGISLLVGAIAALDLRLLGAWRSEPLGPFVRVLPQVAMTGLGLAAITGLLLFSIRPADYAANPAFQLKLLLVLLGTAIALTARWAGTLHRGPAATQKLLGAASLACWTGTLVCGRLIAFTGD